MSSSSYLPESDVFNPSLFLSNTDAITLNIADLRYVRIGSAASLSSLVVGTISGLSKLSIGTIGTQAFNALTGGDCGIRFGNTQSNSKCWTIQYLTATNQIRFDIFGSNSQMTLSAAGDLTAKASIDTPIYKQSGSIIDFGALGSVAGVATASKALILDSDSKVSFLSVGTPNSNCIQFLPNINTTLQEKVGIYREDESVGITIGTKLQNNNYRVSPLLKLFSGADMTSISTNSPAAYVEIIQSFHNLKVGGGTSNQGIASGWFHCYLQPTFSFGGTNCTEYYTSNTAMNLSCNKTATTTLGGSNNMLLNASGQVLFNTTTPTAGYQATFNSGTNNGVSVLGNATLLFLKNTTGTTTDRTSMVFSHNTDWEVSLGGSAHTTAPNALYWYNGGYKMLLTSAGRLGLSGITTPLAPLHVGSGVNTGIAISGVYGEYGSGFSASNQLGPITRSISIRATDGIMTSTSFFSVSDRRTKKDIVNLPLEEAMNFVSNVNPVKYRLRNEDETKHKHLGYIAQSLRNYVDLLNFSECDGLACEEEGDLENVMLSVDYSKVCTLLHTALKHSFERIEKLEELVDKLTSRPVVQNWLKKNI